MLPISQDQQHSMNDNLLFLNLHIIKMTKKASDAPFGDLEALIKQIYTTLLFENLT